MVSSHGADTFSPFFFWCYQRCEALYAFTCVGTSSPTEFLKTSNLLPHKDKFLHQLKYCSLVNAFPFVSYTFLFFSFMFYYVSSKMFQSRLRANGAHSKSWKQFYIGFTIEVHNLVSCAALSMCITGYICSVITLFLPVHKNLSDWVFY